MFARWKINRKAMNFAMQMRGKIDKKSFRTVSCQQLNQHVSFITFFACRIQIMREFFVDFLRKQKFPAQNLIIWNEFTQLKQISSLFSQETLCHITHLSLNCGRVGKSRNHECKNDTSTSSLFIISSTFYDARSLIAFKTSFWYSCLGGNCRKFRNAEKLVRWDVWDSLVTLLFNYFR